MPLSAYLRDLRRLVGSRLLLLPGVAAVIHDAAGRVLLVQTESGWSLPAGAVEPGETPEAAVAREVAEETGLRVTRARLVGAVGGDGFRVRYPSGDEVEYVVSVYACAVDGGAPAAVDGEAQAFAWVAPERVPAQVGLPYPVDLLRPPA